MEAESQDFEEGQDAGAGDMALVPAGEALDVFAGEIQTAARGWIETWAADRGHPVSLWLRNQTRTATRVGYESAAAAFAAWLWREHERDILRASFEDLLDYRDYLAATPLPNGETRRSGTVRSHLDRLGAFYHFLLERGMIAHSPTAGLKVDEADDGRVKLAWEPEQVLELWAVIDREIRHATEHGYATMRTRALRDKAIFALLFRNGLRVSEAAGANVSHLVIQQGEPILQLREDDDREHVKGGHARIAVLIPKTLAAVQAYLEARGLDSPAAVRTARETPLFLRTRDSGRPTKAGVQKKMQDGDDGRISRFGVRDRLRYYGPKAGVPLELCHPHAARRTFVTYLIQAGVPLPEIADDTGHRSMDVLLQYWKHNQQIVNAAARKIKY